MLNINWQELFSEKSWFIGVDAAIEIKKGGAA
jgi:hypothetical protein